MLECPASFCATFINRNFFPDEYRSGNLGVINSGRCYDWAYLAHCLWEDTILWSTDFHAWIQVADRHYDSEAVSGKEDFMNLRTNKMWGWGNLKPQIMSVESFKEYWNNNGAGRRQHWHSLLRDIGQLGLRARRT